MKRFSSFLRMGLLCAALLLTSCGAPPYVGPAMTANTGVDSGVWAKIPAGEFLMGRTDEETMVAAFEIMATPVTNALYAAYLNKALAAGSVKVVGDNVVGPYPGDPYTGKRHEKKIDAGDWLHVPLTEPSLRLTFDGQSAGVKPGYENHPMTIVAWFGARAYCLALGGRLPTETEWEKAARGTDGRAFPWGNEIAKNNANYYNSQDPFEKGVGALGDTTPVGFYNGKAYGGYQTLNSASPYGLYDMAGNVWQWTNNLTEGIHDRYLRGGSKENYSYNLRVWSRNAARPDYYSPNIGFRCVR